MLRQVLARLIGSRLLLVLIIATGVSLVYWAFASKTRRIYVSGLTAEELEPQEEEEQLPRFHFDGSRMEDWRKMYKL